MSRADEKRREAERYRAAAEQALDQLDWAVGYLERIHKSGIAQILGRNRSQIRRQLR